MSSLLLLSGGIDSIAVAAWRRPDLCLTIDYGQNAAEAEIAAAAQVSATLGLSHRVLSLPLGALGQGLMSQGAQRGKFGSDEFWPFRNQLLLTLAAMLAVQEHIATVLIGSVRGDGARHKDGTSAFVEGIADLIRRQEGAVEVCAPALALSSIELVEISRVTQDILGWAHSCHTGITACGRCPGCEKHSDVMEALGFHR